MVRAGQIIENRRGEFCLTAKLDLSPARSAAIGTASVSSFATMVSRRRVSFPRARCGRCSTVIGSLFESSAGSPRPCRRRAGRRTRTRHPRGRRPVHSRAWHRHGHSRQLETLAPHPDSERRSRRRETRPDGRRSRFSITRRMWSRRQGVSSRSSVRPARRASRRTSRFTRTRFLQVAGCRKRAGAGVRCDVPEASKQGRTIFAMSISSLSMARMLVISMTPSSARRQARVATAGCYCRCCQLREHRFGPRQGSDRARHLGVFSGSGRADASGSAVEWLCSLNPKVDRLCMVCDMRVSSAGKVTKATFFEGVMKSKARLTYSQVGDFLTGASKTSVPRELAGVGKRLARSLQGICEATPPSRCHRDRFAADKIQAQ